MVRVTFASMSSPFWRNETKTPKHGTLLAFPPAERDWNWHDIEPSAARLTKYVIVGRHVLPAFEPPIRAEKPSISESERFFHMVVHSFVRNPPYRSEKPSSCSEGTSSVQPMSQIDIPVPSTVFVNFER